jgi:hypothetical protein
MHQCLKNLNLESLAVKNLGLLAKFDDFVEGLINCHEIDLTGNGISTK